MVKICENMEFSEKLVWTHDEMIPYYGIQQSKWKISLATGENKS